MSKKTVRLSRLAGAFALVGVATAALVALPGRADACGGLFCNARPPDPFAPLPVAQNGENVVFAITKDPKGGAPTIEADIQILYTGDVAKFSWVVPVDSVPTLGTGTDLLFSRLAALTRPSFQARYETDGTCKPYGYPSADAGGFAGTTGSAGSTGATGAGGAGGSAVQVAFQGAVGPFDAAVVKSDDPTALKKWLTDNAYVVSDQASGLIDGYVQENKYFVALKLLNGVGVNQIQPITLTFKGTEACVPLKLTAIAANPDMPVLVWVFGDTRVAPRGYHEIQVDDAAINWVQGGSNYFGPSGLVSKAANEAGGKAFITEYAGPATIASASVYRNGQIDLTALKAAMTPPVYVQALIGMGLTSDPLMLGLLQKYIPMPDAVKNMNVTPNQFYGNLQFYWAQFAFPPFDLAGLTDAISTSIVKPRLAAQMLIDGHPMLTRLQTFISPAEMDKDAFFFETQDLPNLSNVRTATIRTMCSPEYLYCNAPQRLELADGRKLALRQGTSDAYCTAYYNATDPYPKFIATLPAASVAYDRELMGDGTVVLDNRTKINSAISTYNAAFLKPFNPGGGDGGGAAEGDGGADDGGIAGLDGATGGRDGGDDGNPGPSVPDGGGAGGTGGTTQHPADNLGETGGGCSCDVGAGSSGFALVVAAGALGVALTRCRRR